MASVSRILGKRKVCNRLPSRYGSKSLFPNKSKFDPRKWLIKGEEKMQNTVMDFCNISGSAQNSILL